MLTGTVIAVMLHLYVGGDRGRSRAEWVEISQSGYRRGSTSVDLQSMSESASTLGVSSHTHGVTVHNVQPSRPPGNFGQPPDMFVLEDDSQYYGNISVPGSKIKETLRRRVNIGSVEKVSKSSEVPIRKEIQELPSAVVSEDSNSAELYFQKGGRKTERPPESHPVADVIPNVDETEPVSKIHSIIDINTNISEDTIKPPRHLKEQSDISQEEMTESTEDIVKKIPDESEKQNTSEKTTAQNDKSHFKTLAGIVKVLKVVQETISKTAHRTVHSKMKYLEELRDGIMYSIEDRMERLWPLGVASAPVEGRARAGRSTSRGEHIDFPSAESALMSISFLTFAVFLVKLVMQVIQTYKSKAMMLTPVFTAMGKATLNQTKK